MVRAWQTVDASENGVRVICRCELDLAAGREQVNLRYASFDSAHRRQLMHELGAWWSAFGDQAPEHRSILVVSRGDSDRGVLDRYPSMQPPTVSGATILSADAAEIAILRRALADGTVLIDRGRPVVADGGGAQVATVVSRLWEDGRLLFFPKGRQDHHRSNRPVDPRVDLLAPLNPKAGVLTESDRLGHPLAAFNAGFFVWAEEEFLDGPFAFMHDPVGLVLEEGAIRWPPIYRRSALVVDTGTYALADHEQSHGLGADRLTFGRCGLAELAVYLPGDVVVKGPSYRGGFRSFAQGTDGLCVIPAQVNEPAAPSEAAFINRLWPEEGVRCVSRHTPQPAEGRRYELVIVGQAIVACTTEGGVFIPSHGFVISIANRDAQRRVETALSDGAPPLVEFDLDLGPVCRAPVAAAQGWLPLLVASRPTDLEALVASEEYVPISAAEGNTAIPPIYLHDRYVFAPNRALIGLGLRADGRAHVALIESCEARTYHPEIDSVGGSTSDLQVLLGNLGAVQGLAFDPGGSAALVVGGQQLARAADRNDLACVPAKRPIPGGWVVRAAGG